jgi:hypothetical protein
MSLVIKICTLENDNIWETEDKVWSNHIQKTIYNLQAKKWIEHIKGSKY